MASPDRANREAIALRAVSDFLKGLFTVADPDDARGNSITARELLDRSAAGIDQRLTEQPETQAELMDTIGNIYLKLGLYEQAQPQLERASRMRSQLLGEDHPDALQSRHNLAVLARTQARYDEAEALLEAIVATRRRVLPAFDPKTLDSIHEFGTAYLWHGRFEEAEALLATNLEDRRRVIGSGHPETANSMASLAQLYRRTSRYDEAEPKLRRSTVRSWRFADRSWGRNIRRPWRRSTTWPTLCSLSASTTRPRPSIAGAWKPRDGCSATSTMRPFSPSTDWAGC